MSIRDSLGDLVDMELKVIHENEGEYHRLQSEHYRLQQQIEEQDRVRRDQEGLQFDNPSCSDEVTPLNLLKSAAEESGFGSCELGVSKDEMISSSMLIEPAKMITP